MLNDKIYKNALINSQTDKLTKRERSLIIIQLLKSRSQRELSEELNIPQTTLSDWKLCKEESRDQSNINFNSFINKLNDIDKETFTDWGRIEQIKNICEELLRN